MIHSRYSTRIRTRGFTIVELLIVIIVIAILAMIVLVTFRGLNERAKITAVKDGVANAKRAIELDKATRGEYASDLSQVSTLQNAGPSGTTFQFTRTGSGNAAGYCVTGAYDDKSYFSSNDDAEIRPGACPGHANSSVPLNSQVVHTQVGSFSGPRANTYTITLGTTLVDNDFVFIVFNHDPVNTLSTVNYNGAPMNNVSAKKAISGRPTTGRQALAAYSSVSTGTTGSITLSDIGGPPTWSDAYGRYVVYVIRGLQGTPTVATADTSYGDQPNNTSLTTAPLTVVKGQVVIMSYVYYSYAGPAVLADVSSPGITWTTNSARDSTTAMSFPGTTSNALSAAHGVTSQSGQMSYRLTTPASGTESYQGAGLSVFAIR